MKRSVDKMLQAISKIYVKEDQINEFVEVEIHQDEENPANKSLFIQ